MRAADDATALHRKHRQHRGPRPASPGTTARSADPGAPSAAADDVRRATDLPTAAFGLWDTDKMVFPLDASGVSFAAIQALNTRLVAAEADNEALRARLDRLERALELRSDRR